MKMNAKVEKLEKIVRKGDEESENSADKLRRKGGIAKQEEE